MNQAISSRDRKILTKAGECCPENSVQRKNLQVTITQRLKNKMVSDNLFSYISHFLAFSLPDFLQCSELQMTGFLLYELQRTFFSFPSLSTWDECTDDQDINFKMPSPSPSSKRSERILHKQQMLGEIQGINVYGELTPCNWSTRKSPRKM